MQPISSSQTIKEVDSMEWKSSKYREVTGINGNNNKFIDNEEHGCSSDNNLINKVDTSSETDQQQYLIGFQLKKGKLMMPKMILKIPSWGIHEWAIICY